MAACPVCETPIPPGALECATCGHIFLLAAVDASIVPLAELEPTSAKDLDVPVEVTPGLEATAFEAATVAPEAPMSDLDPTSAAPVQVAAEATPDFMPTRVAEDELPSALPAAIRCRYCGTEGQTQGIFCDRCGMRLPRIAGNEIPGLAPDAVVPDGTKCRNCGWKVFANGRCTECGTAAPVP